MIKRISILGSTGSVGTQALCVAEALGITPVALTGNRNIKLMEEQARRYKPKLVAMHDASAANALKASLSDTETTVLSGTDGLILAATARDADMVLASVVGIAGLAPTLAAIEHGHDIALANKETLVCAGELVMKRAKEKGVRIIPVDSEHSAIFQCLQGENPKSIKRIILTASGGPFFGKTRQDLKTVTRAQALAHPNWSMGAKISIDSATLMNKGLELIEAVRLFGVSPDMVEVVVHRESIIHSMAEYSDGSVIAQLGLADMRLPISYAMTYPERRDFGGKSISFTELPPLTFNPPDLETFSCLALAKKAVALGGTACASLNGANEAAVELFLNDKISFLQIGEFVENAMDRISIKQNPTLADIFDADAEARSMLYSYI